MLNNCCQVVAQVAAGAIPLAIEQDKALNQLTFNALCSEVIPVKFCGNFTRMVYTSNNCIKLADGA